MLASPQMKITVEDSKENEREQYKCLILGWKIDLLKI